MRSLEAGRHRPSARRTALTLVLAAFAVGAPQGIRASSFGDAAPEPVVRGRAVLNAREAVLREQALHARQVARARGLMLYRVLRLAALERRVAPPAPGAAPRLGGRAVALGSAVLERDLAEARALHDEWERVRGLRGSLGEVSTPAADPPPGSPGTARPPTLVPPVSGVVLGPFGVVRDAATSAWWFRSAVVLAAHPGEAVRSPAGGRVVRVAPSLSGGEAIALETDVPGWSVIVSGLAAVTAVQGQMLRRGETVGQAETAAGATVRLEVWRGRVPLEPAALFGR